ncbi:Gfo/Idh/MocA family protein [Ereboglobus luteus]|uniref:Oxidoreductase n=1 Tax=Ereboglobus luteus TaxID=1796921 RepID=A0A2U8DZP7_9BACT|nr:Gfo/Idh/MocA family oxidoreductase [Ereboglobus luteus]AWI08066.1 oxidoreductase [Ereboglobus luteus]
MKKSSKKTTIGIIGAGGMSRYHAEGFRSAGAEIAAIADTNPAAAAKTAARENVARSFGSVEEMLRDCPEINAVSIIVPNKFHAPLALQALKAGKHVFCEKPPALNAREARAMAAAAAKARRTLMFDFNNRARPESRAMKAYIDQGVAGRINSAQAKWIRRTGIPGFGGWFTSKALSGGGPVIDLLHMLDLALHFMGYPEPEWALGQTFTDFITDKQFKGPWGIPDAKNGVTDVENACHGFIRFKTGQVLTMQSSWAELVKREEVSVAFQGTKAGGLVRRLFGQDGIDSTATDTCELYSQENGHSVNRDIIVPPDETMGRVSAAANFVAAIEGREKPLNTAAEAVTLMRIIDALYTSAKTGKPAKC